MNSCTCVQPLKIKTNQIFHFLDTATTHSVVLRQPVSYLVKYTEKMLKDLCLNENIIGILAEIPQGNFPI